MTPPRETLFHTKYAAELYRIACDDYKAGAHLGSAKQIRKEIALFHFQQCVEKCLKAYLCTKKEPVPTIHTIETLVQMVRKHETPPFAQESIELTPFAGIRRYEEGKSVISDHQFLSFQKIAENILSWCYEHLASRNYEVDQPN